LLSGVVRVANLMQAQTGSGLTLLWAHRLEKLQQFIDAPR
jgi:hypothetical protein